MGEAKWRKTRRDSGSELSNVAINAPEVAALLVKGQPITVHLMGAAAILQAMMALPSDHLMAPEHHALRLTFKMLDRIRTGETPHWHCLLCGAKHSGVKALSVIALLERALEEPKPNKPAVGGPICHACDSVSTDNTRKRVQTLFGVYDLQTGHA